MTPDRDLVAAFQLGRKEAFGELYDRYIEKIYRFVYYKTQHKETAEDIVSDVFMKAVAKLDDFDASAGTFQAWIYRIARNAVIDHYRGRKQDQNIEDIWDLAATGDIERDTDMKNRLAQVEKYLSTLKPEQRDIIMLRIWQDLPYQEIAAILGKSEASCKMAFSRGIKDLRKAMPADLFVLLLLFDVVMRSSQ